MNKRKVVAILVGALFGGSITFLGLQYFHSKEKVVSEHKQESIVSRLNSECTKQVIVQYRPNGQYDISGFESFGLNRDITDLQHEKEIALEDVQRALTEKENVRLNVVEGRCLVQIDFKE